MICRTIRRTTRTTLALTLTAAALGSCGKSKQQPTGPIGNTGPIESAAGMGGDAYGGDAYGGDMYGSDSDRAEGQYRMQHADEGEEGGVEGGVIGGVWPHANFTGRWVGPCAGDKKAGFTRSTIDLTGGDWDLHREVFADAGCTKRRSSTHLGGTYIADAESTTVPGAWNTSFALTRRDLTADDKKTAAALGKTCKVKLAVGVAADIHTAGCPKLGLRPAADCGQEFELVSASGNLLHLGQRPADNDVCSEAKRPTALSTVDLTWRSLPSGIPECDALGAQYEKLFACTSAQVTVELKDAVRESLGMMLSTVTTLPPDARQSMVEACKAAEQAIAQGAPGMGC